MNALIVTAHPEPRSYTLAMAETVRSTLKDLGWETRVFDLHAARFDPVLRAEQFPTRSLAARFEVMTEQASQAKQPDQPPDIAESQALLEWSDLLVLVFPLWWWSMPALMKGWIDRVFSAGFAYGDADLSGRTAMLCVTAETTAARFEVEGDAHPLNHIERGILKFCGFETLQPFVVSDVYTIGPAGRAERLEALGRHVVQRIGRASAKRCA